MNTDLNSREYQYQLLSLHVIMLALVLSYTFIAET